MINWWSLTGLVGSIGLVALEWPSPGWVLYGGCLAGFNAAILIVSRYG